MEDAVMDELAQVRLFDGIGRQDMPHMLGCIGAVRRCYSKGEFIIMEGDDVQQIGLVLGGNVQIIKEDVWGDKMILSQLSAGEIFGESFVCGDKVASTVACLAVNDCQVLMLPFRRLLTSCHMACRFHQQLIENMVVMLARKNLQLMKKMEILSKKTIRERVLVWLSQQAQQAGSWHFTAQLGRVELAEYLCVDRSALTRELANMKSQGLVDYHKNHFELPQ